MTVELIKDLLSVGRSVGQELIQTIVEGDAIVPDTKPDALKILSVDAVPIITSRDIQKDKLTLEGNLKFKVLYLSSNSQQPIHSIEVTSSFKEVLETSGLKDNMTVVVDNQVEHVDYVVENSRKMRFKAVLNLNVDISDTSTVNLVKEIKGLDNIQLLKDTVKYREIVGSNSAQTIVRETIDIEENLPEIEEILRVDGKVIAKEIKAADNKVIVSGVTDINILYWGNSEELSINSVNHQMPFTHFVDIPGTYRDMDNEVGFEIEEIFTEVKENIIGEKKILDVEAVVTIKASVMENHDLEVIVDAYCPGKGLEIIKDKVNIGKVIGQDTSSLEIKDTVEIPVSSAGIEKVYSVDGKILVTDCRIMEDKCIVEGVVATHILYMSKDKNQPILSLKEDIPFRHFIEVAENKDVEVKVKANITKTDYTVISDEQLQLNYEIEIKGTVFKNAGIDVITKINEKEGEFLSGPKSSIVVYIVQPEDTLWKIAKKYNTTIEDIMSANEIEDVNSIMPGEQIIIQKVVKYKLNK